MRPIQSYRKVIARSNSDPRFERDWTTLNADIWLRLLGRFSHQPNIHGIEIGSFEGRSSLFFLENVLQHETSSLTCIDPSPRPVFRRTIRPFRNKVQFLGEPSHLALRRRTFIPNSFHFVYIDGNHRAPSVLSDAVLSFPLLNRGGIMIFDDYLWESNSPDVPQTMPKIAVDSFVRVYKDRLRVLHRGWQIAVEKIA